MEKHVRKARWEEDYEMIENEGLFEEYLEMGKFFRILCCSTCIVAYPASRLIYDEELGVYRGFQKERVVELVPF
jgi:hypothetical protein